MCGIKSFCFQLFFCVCLVGNSFRASFRVRRQPQQQEEHKPKPVMKLEGFPGPSHNYSPIPPQCISEPSLLPQPRTLSSLQAVRETSHLWHQPCMSRTEVVRWLLHTEAGTFIVRNSSQPNSVALSISTPNGRVGHFLLNKFPTGHYCLQHSENMFATIYELLAHYCDIKSAGLPCQLVIPLDLTRTASHNSTHSCPAQCLDAVGRRLARPGEIQSDKSQADRKRACTFNTGAARREYAIEKVEQSFLSPDMCEYVTMESGGALVISSTRPALSTEDNENEYVEMRPSYQ